MDSLSKQADNVKYFFLSEYGLFRFFCILDFGSEAGHIGHR